MGWERLAGKQNSNESGRDSNAKLRMREALLSTNSLDPRHEGFPAKIALLGLRRKNMKRGQARVKEAGAAKGSTDAIPRRVPQPTS